MSTKIKASQVLEKLEQAGMNLLALPYEPNLAEWLMLANRRILADQQAFLERLAPKRDRMSA